AGDDQDLCNNSMFTLSASSASPGTGLWTLESGSATITNPSLPTTTVTGVAPGTSVDLRWTVTNGPCTSSDVVTLTNSATFPVVSAGDDQELCDTDDFALNASPVPAGGAGLWTFSGPDHGASIADASSPTSALN